MSEEKSPKVDTQDDTAPVPTPQPAEAPTAQVRVHNQGTALPASTSSIDQSSVAAPDKEGGPANAQTASAQTSDADATGSATEPPTTTALLTMRPPEDEVRRRSQLRDAAPERSYKGARVVQTLLAILVPFLLVFGALRLVATHVFLWVEYNRPGFPADTAFSTGERVDYGSYAVDYLFNFASPAYLGDLMNKNEQNLFLPSEVSHMADVKVVMLIGVAIAVVMLIAAIVFAIILARKYKGGIRRALFAGSVATAVIIIALAVVAALGWQQFFTAFHEIFFAQGNWQFRSTDTLIRLFPTQFWIDAAGTAAALALVGAIVTMIFTWPTAKRRARSMELQEFIEARERAEDQAAS